jgi:hypothetical protein
MGLLPGLVRPQAMQMLKFLSLLLIPFWLAGCATEEKLAVGQKCWEHSVKVSESARNLILLCSQGGIATSTIHFANPDSSPTTCAQSGMTEVVSKVSSNFTLQRGICTNGRILEARSIACVTEADGALLCSAPDLPAPMRFSLSASKL